MNVLKLFSLKLALFLKKITEIVVKSLQSIYHHMIKDIRYLHVNLFAVFNSKLILRIDYMLNYFFYTNNTSSYWHTSYLDIFSVNMIIHGSDIALLQN
jgi:hypothetical protein